MDVRRRVPRDGSGGDGRGRPNRRTRFLYVVLALAILAATILVAVGQKVGPGTSPVVILGFAAATLEHPTRALILDHLEAVPGDYFRAIVRSVGVSVGETRHHLNILLRRRRVREERQERLCRYYACGPAAQERNKAFQTLWATRDTRLQVLLTLQARHVVRPSDVAAAIGISRQLAGYHLKHLAASGKVDRDRGTYRLRGHHVDRADRGSGNVTRQSSD